MRIFLIILCIRFKLGNLFIEGKKIENYDFFLDNLFGLNYRKINCFSKVVDL